MTALSPATVQAAECRINSDVFHRDLAYAGGDALFRVDALVEFGLGGPLDMDDGDNPLVVQESVVGPAVVSPVGDHRRGPEPGIQGLGTVDHGRQFRRVVPLGCCDELGDRDAVVGVGRHVDLIAKEPFLAALLGPGAGLGGPTGLRVANTLPVGIGVAADCGRVDSDFLAQVRQQVLEPAGDLDEASFDKVGMVGEALNEMPVSGLLLSESILPVE